MINDVIQDTIQGKTGMQINRTSRPLVRADIISYKGVSLLVTHVHDKGRTVGKVVTLVEEITNLAGKITEIVEGSCGREKPIAYDLHTCSDIIYKEALSSAYVLVQMESECKECEEIIHDLATIDAKFFSDEGKVTQQEKSAREKLKRIFKTMGKKLYKLLN
ncbi:hypothetical protein JNB07_18660 [Bacillus pacificus]|uniref:hypothetical protein n=1 Tax=Bacillus pacificus TaxID=2026187 RepID=UPI003A7F7FBC